MLRLMDIYPLALLCLLLVTIAAATEKETRGRRHQYYTSVHFPQSAQYHSYNGPASSSRRPPSYFESIKKPKRIESSPKVHSYHILYDPEPPAYPHAAEPVRAAIASYFPIDFNEPKPYFSDGPETIPILPSYYPKDEPIKPISYYPVVPAETVKPDYVPAPYSDFPHCPKMGGLQSQCRLTSECAVWYDLVLSYLPDSACLLGDGEPGTCCPEIPINGQQRNFKNARKIVALDRNIDIYSVNAAAHAGKFYVRTQDDTEQLIAINNVTMRLNSAEFTHFLFFQTVNGTRNISRDAWIVVETARELGKRFELSPEAAAFGLSQFNVRDTILSVTCPANPVCDASIINSPFRTADGSCNNIQNPLWGNSKTQSQRLLVPNYADGVWTPRRAVSGAQLPSPRLVSISIVQDIDSPAETNTLWVMQFGQFLDHDFTSSPIFRMNTNGNGIQCCTDDGQFLNKTEFIHPACLPIAIPNDDPFFSKFGRVCMNFVRTTPAPRLDCLLGYTEQMNQVTHFIDHSNVYGSDLNETMGLRTFVGGALNVTTRRGHHELPLLPPDENATTNCTLSKNVTGIEPPNDVKCFKAGDFRVNQTPDLAVAQTIFLRQHNLLAAELAGINPHWDDERLFQEARRILIAQTQHITYNEFLPIVLGRDKMESLGMLPLQSGFSNDYDESINPSMLNDFSTAAYRFGHSLIQGKVHLINQRGKKVSSILLRQHFFKPQLLYTPGNVDKFLIGLATQPSQEFDNYFTEEVQNHLFEADGTGFGLDLVSLNIQRGRDHGLPGYNAYRALCGLPRARSFKDLLDVIPAAILERFELLYESVDDVDFFIAGVSERPVAGSIVGPTFQCVLADQFLRLKRGDRYFYDLAGQAGSFTEDQLNEIRRTSLARIVCDNSNVQSSQPLAFKSDSAANPIVDCKSSAISRTSLFPWKEESTKPAAASRYNNRPHLRYY